MTTIPKYNSVGMRDISLVTLKQNDLDMESVCY